MTCERCGTTLVGDGPCACVFRGYLFEALLKSKRDAATRPGPSAWPKRAPKPGVVIPPWPEPVATVPGPSPADESGLVRSFVPPLGPFGPTIAPDGADLGPGDWPELRSPDAPVASAGPFAPGGLLAPGGAFRPPVGPPPCPGPGFGDPVGWVRPAAIGWVGEPTPATQLHTLPVNRHWVRVTMVVAVTMLLVLGAAGAYLQFKPGRSTYPSRWDPRVVGIVQFVEHERGLKFLHPVAVDFLAEEQFKAKVASKPPSAKDKLALQHVVGEMRALGLIHGDADLAAMDSQLTQASVIGVYVPSDKRVYVRGSALTPEVRVTLAHELTHALQDQHFDLQRLDRLPKADSSAVRALVEGDAMRVEDAYIPTMSVEDQAAYQQANQAQAGAADLKGVSQVLIDGFSFPYVFGPVFVKALVANGGTAALDRALASPPTVDAQVVDPNRYLIQTDVATVAAPALAAGDTRLAPASFFGQVGLLQVVGATVGYEAAWSALESWRGDESIGYLHDGQVCIAIASAFDGPEHATAFAAVARRWAAGRGAASVQSNAKTVELRACDPGAAATAGPLASPSPFEVLSLRASLIGDLIDHAKAPADVAGCIADQVIGTVGPEPLMANVAPGTTNTAVAQASAQAARVCGYAPPQGSTSG